MSAPARLVRAPRAPFLVPCAAFLLAVAPAAFGAPPAPAQEDGDAANADAVIGDDATGDDAAAQVAALDAEAVAAREAALAALLGAEPDERRVALAAPRPTGTAGRRAFAVFAAAAGVPEAVGPLLALVGDPDAVVRRTAAEGLGRVDLSDARLDERVGALRRAAARDADPAVRAAALAALGDLDHPASATALAGLVAAGGEGAAPAAEALAGLLAADAPLAELLERTVAGDPDAPDDPAVLAALLGGYGGALARGASEPAVGARVLTGLGQSVDRPTNEAATAALSEALVGWDRLDDTASADLFLSALAASGWPLDALDQAVARRGLGENGRPERTLAAGERLERRHRFTRGLDGARAAADGLVFQAAALLIEGDAAAAGAKLAAAETLLEGAIERRPDHGARPFEGHAGRAATAVDVLQRLAAVRLVQVLTAITAGAEPFDRPVLERARAAHVAALRAQLVALRGDSEAWATSLEAVLGRTLSPTELIAPLARGDDAGVWLERIGRALAALEAVSGHELPGFVGALDAGALDAGALDTGALERVAALPDALTDPIADPERRELLRAMRIADLERVGRRIADPAERANRRLWQLVEADLLEKMAREQSEGFATLAEYRSVASTALEHANRWRGAGDGARALAHATALREALRDDPNAPTGVFGTLLGARVALAIGTALTDLDRGDEAEAELLDARERLVAYENELVARAAELEAGRMGVQQLAAVDPVERRRNQARLDATRDLRAQVLVSLAVNANVRLDDVEAAKAYFDAAFELRQDDFMRVLAACYAARTGRADEARFLLSSLRPARGLEYNLACTFALLGEAERALTHLEAALLDLPGRRARARQAEWARDDPDLASLVGDPRFEALLERFADAGEDGAEAR